MLFAVVNFLKRVATEVVLFSIVAFKTLDISQLNTRQCSDTFKVWWDLW